MTFGRPSSQGARERALRRGGEAHRPLGRPSSRRARGRSLRRVEEARRPFGRPSSPRMVLRRGLAPRCAATAPDAVRIVRGVHSVANASPQRRQRLSALEWHSFLVRARRQCLLLLLVAVGGGVTDMFYLFGPPQVGRCHRAHIPFGMLRAVLELEVPKAAPNACPRRELLFSIKLKEGAVMKKLPSSCVESPRERALAGDPRHGLN